MSWTPSLIRRSTTSQKTSSLMIDWTDIHPGRASGEIVGDFKPGMIFLT